jgi:hypothetical protein
MDADEPAVHVAYHGKQRGQSYRVIEAATGVRTARMEAQVSTRNEMTDAASFEVDGTQNQAAA